jgi:RNA polymerase sigma-70 factor (ECF subfamily)
MNTAVAVRNEITHIATYREDESDATLVALALGGDGPGFELLIQRYRGLFFSLIHKISRNETDAEDVFQQATFRIYLKLDTLQEPAFFRPWACRVVTNAALAARRTRRRRQSLAPEAHDENLDFLSDPSPGVDTRAHNNELLLMTNTWMGQLADHERDILERYAWQGQTMQEIAQVHQMTTAAVKAHAFRARVFLKAQRAYHFGEQRPSPASITGRG